MTDLEDELRAMLHERAADVATLPSRLTELPAKRSTPWHRRTGWLVAAAVAAILAVAGSAVLVSTIGGRHDRLPADHHSPLVSTSPSPTPTTKEHIRRDVDLTWFGFRRPAGFDVHVWSSVPGYRLLGVRARSDKDMPVGCNGCEEATDYVYVYDKGAFDAARHEVTGWTRTAVGGRTAYEGTMAWTSAQDHQVPTLAWQFAPDRWALVQGVTQLGGRSATLRRVAAAVRPADSVPIGLPFTFDYLPDLPLTEITDDRAEGYSFVMSFGSPKGTQFDIELVNARQLRGHYDTEHAVAKDVDGLPGYFDSDEGVGVRYHGGIAMFGLSGDFSNADALTDAAKARAAQEEAQRAEQVERVVRGLHWTNRDGSAPYVPAERAIP